MWRVVRVLPAVLALGPMAFAEIYVVTPDGTGDFPTIQAAIDFASDGEIIELADGTFHGAGNRNLDYHGKAIIVRSTSGVPETCIIDCEGREGNAHRGFLFTSGEGLTSVLEEITIAHGYAMSGDWPAGFGGGIFCQGTSPTIVSCTFYADTSTYGGAISCSDSSSPTLIDCTFLANWTRWFGGAAWCQTSSSPAFVGCRFTENESGGVCGGAGGALTSAPDCAPTFEDCTFSGNWVQYWGGVLYSYGGSPTFTNCTLYGNRADMWASAIYCADGSVVLDNTIVALGSGDGAIRCDDGSVTLTCCDVYGNAAGDWVGHIADQYGINGNISLHPLLCDPENGDFTLAEDSPCAPFSPPNDECDLIGAWPAGCGPMGLPDDRHAGGSCFLLHASPNPLVRRTRIEFRTPVATRNSAPHLAIYDVAGRLGRTFQTSPQPSGTQSASRDGRDQEQNRVGSGMYYARLRAGAGCDRSPDAVALSQPHLLSLIAEVVNCPLPDPERDTSVNHLAG